MHCLEPVFFGTRTISPLFIQMALDAKLISSIEDLKVPNQKE